MLKKLKFTSPHADFRITDKANLVGGSQAEHIIFHALKITQKPRLARVNWHMNRELAINKKKQNNFKLLQRRFAMPPTFGCRSVVFFSFLFFDSDIIAPSDSRLELGQIKTHDLKKMKTFGGKNYDFNQSVERLSQK